MSPIRFWMVDGGSTSETSVTVPEPVQVLAVTLRPR